MRAALRTWVRQPLGLDEMHGRVSCVSKLSMLPRDHAARREGRQKNVGSVLDDLDKLRTSRSCLALATREVAWTDV